MIKNQLKKNELIKYINNLKGGIIMLKIILLVVLLIAVAFVMSLAKISSVSDEQMEKMYKEYKDKSETKVADKEHEQYE